jgi:glycosyltransferase involved in cell wall biosynthesis
VANSVSLKDLAGKTLQNHAIHVMPNMIDTDLFCPSQTIKVDGVVKIISVGRLNKQKGLNILLESFAILVQGNTSIDFSLDIVGNGAEKSNLIKQSVMLNITKRINFRGWIKRINLVKSYQESDIFVSSSLDEGMPNSMLEAMACGLPIVASDIPAHREIIKSGENGLLISSQNPKELAGAIEILVKNKSLRQELGKNNVKKIKKYSLESKTVVL